MNLTAAPARRLDLTESMGVAAEVVHEDLGGRVASRELADVLEGRLEGRVVVDVVTASADPAPVEDLDHMKEPSHFATIEPTGPGCQGRMT